MDDLPISIGSGHAWNGRLGGMVRLQGPWSIGGMYTGLRATKRGSRSSTTSTGLVFGTSASSTNSNVKVKTQADIVDLQAGYDVGLGSAGATLLGGLRGAEFRQDTDAQVFSSPTARIPFTGTGHRGSTYYGLGPTIGAKAAYPIAGGFGIEGNGLAGVLFGHQTTITSATNSSNAVSQLPRGEGKPRGHDVRIASGADLCVSRGRERVQTGRGLRRLFGSITCATPAVTWNPPIRPSEAARTTCSSTARSRG